MTFALERLDKTLMALFAETNRCMFSLRSSLGSHPAANAVRGGCEIWMCHDAMRENEEVYCFESCVEVDQRGGGTFWWSVDMSLSPSGWAVGRNIFRQGGHGREVVVEFEEFSFKSLDELVGRHAALMQELVESANNFEFGSVDEKAPWWRIFWKK